MSTQPTFQIPQDLIKPAIESAINSAIVENLGNSHVLIQNAISSVLNHKVDSEGKTSNASYHTTNYLQWVTNDVIKKAIRSTLEQEMSKHQKQIEEQLRAELSKKNSPLLKTLVEGFAKGVIDAASSSYRLVVSIADR